MREKETITPDQEAIYRRMGEAGIPERMYDTKLSDHPRYKSLADKIRNDVDTTGELSETYKFMRIEGLRARELSPLLCRTMVVLGHHCRIVDMADLLVGDWGEVREWGKYPGHLFIEAWYSPCRDPKPDPFEPARRLAIERMITERLREKRMTSLTCEGEDPKLFWSLALVSLVKDTTTEIRA